MSDKLSDPLLLGAIVRVNLLVCCDVEHDLQVSVSTAGVKVFQVAGKEGNGRNHFIICANDEVDDGDGCGGQQ